ncbi:MAG: DUF1579 domain-containing protein [Planctomycetota bacterium]|nr:DUF1579 domain-containing protein [Planctomycetota bacterium]
MTEQSSTAAECTQMGALDDAHKNFEPFVGTFRAEVKMWMGPGEPFVSTGAMTNTFDLGGRFLRQEYKGDKNDGPFPDFEGRGFWGYNTVTKKYEGFWIDTASTFMQHETGDLDASGKAWTMVGECTNPQTGQPMQKRSVITLQDNDHHSMAMYFPGPDGQEVKGMEINYTRAS